MRARVAVTTAFPCLRRAADTGMGLPEPNMHFFAKLDVCSQIPWFEASLAAPLQIQPCFATKVPYRFALCPVADDFEAFLLNHSYSLFQSLMCAAVVATRDRSKPPFPPAYPCVRRGHPRARRDHGLLFLHRLDHYPATAGWAAEWAPRPRERVGQQRGRKRSSVPQPRRRTQRNYGPELKQQHCSNNLIRSTSN